MQNHKDIIPTKFMSLETSNSEQSINQQVRLTNIVYISFSTVQPGNAKKYQGA